MGLFSNIQHEKQNSGGEKLSPGARWDELKLYDVLTYVIVSCDDTTEIPAWISLKYGKIWLAILPVVNFSVLTADVNLTMNLLSSRYFLKFGECYWQYTNHMPNWPLSITFKWKTEEKHIPSIVWIFWEWMEKIWLPCPSQNFFLNIQIIGIIYFFTAFNHSSIYNFLWIKRTFKTLWAKAPWFSGSKMRGSHMTNFPGFIHART